MLSLEFWCVNESLSGIAKNRVVSQWFEDHFSLDEDDDESKLGAELKWFTADQIIEEALFVYPGKVVLNRGYLPVAACLAGSGDPYFLRMKGSSSDDPALVRIPHDLVADDDSYPESEIEVVCSSLSRFFNLADIG